VDVADDKPTKQRASHGALMFLLGSEA